MKKLVSIALGMMICLLSIGMAGCNGGFKNVLSVEYTANGTTTTYTSQITIESDNIERIVNIPSGNEIEFSSFVRTKDFSYEVDKTKSNIKKYKIGSTFFVADVRGARYTGTVKKTIIQYVGVKIRNDKKLEIRKPNGEIIQVLADTYIIEKFN